VQPVNNKEDREQKKGKTELSRRDFLKLTGTIIVGAGLGSCVYVIPVSGGYILVDPKKCQGCVSCMLACSLVHEGVENLSLSRIQVMQNSFEKWPDDLTIEQCRQCVTPACVQACSYAPSRSVWNTEEKHAQTCDLCANTPYHWDEAGGGPDGKQACVEVCPVGAIKFTKEIPVQEGNSGYKVNLRGESWAKLGYPTD
jgi:protein NrfC